MSILNRQTISWSTFKVANTKVHVWQASLDQPAGVVQKLEAVLSDEERQRVEKFRYQVHRQSFIVGRGVLRNLLYCYTDIQPEQIQFKYNLAGKPFLSDVEAVPQIEFSVSHSESLVLYAISWGQRVGIDVECVRPIDDMDQVAELNFSPGEFARFRTMSEREKMRAFYNCWTRKEAFIKAIGEGMSFPLQEFEVSFETDLPAEILSIHSSAEEANNWTLHDLKTWDGYAGALVVEGRDHSISHKRWCSL